MLIPLHALKENNEISSVVVYINLELTLFILPGDSVGSKIIIGSHQIHVYETIEDIINLYETEKKKCLWIVPNG